MAFAPCQPTVMYSIDGALNFFIAQVWLFIQLDTDCITYYVNTAMCLLVFFCLFVCCFFFLLLVSVVAVRDSNIGCLWAAVCESGSVVTHIYFKSHVPTKPSHPKMEYTISCKYKQGKFIKAWRSSRTIRSAISWDHAKRVGWWKRKLQTVAQWLSGRWPWSKKCAWWTLFNPA